MLARDVGAGEFQVESAVARGLDLDIPGLAPEGDGHGAAASDLGVGQFGESGFAEVRVEHRHLEAGVLVAELGCDAFAVGRLGAARQSDFEALPVNALGDLGHRDLPGCVGDLLDRVDRVDLPALAVAVGDELEQRRLVTRRIEPLRQRDCDPLDARQAGSSLGSSSTDMRRRPEPNTEIRQGCDVDVPADQARRIRSGLLAAVGPGDPELHSTLEEQ
ncbi:MAG: hypothetical protein ACRCYQ_14060, partial [Nocardioides sp.]